VVSVADIGSIALAATFRAHYLQLCLILER
jgi:hypothetical protein